MNSTPIFLSVKILYSVKTFLLDYSVIYHDFRKNKENINIFGGQTENDENRK